jgi:multidrug transporter EmrE-like cation transporter
MDVWISIICNVLAAIFGSIFIKYYLINKDIMWLFLAFLCYLVLPFNYMNIYTNNNVSSLYTVVNVVSIIFITIYSFIFFNETCDFNTCLGLALCIGGVWLLTNNIK